MRKLTIAAFFLLAWALPTSPRAEEKPVISQLTFPSCGVQIETDIPLLAQGFIGVMVGEITPESFLSLAQTDDQRALFQRFIHECVLEGEGT